MVELFRNGAISFARLVAEDQVEAALVHCFTAHLYLPSHSLIRFGAACAAFKCARAVHSFPCLCLGRV